MPGASMCGNVQATAPACAGYGSDIHTPAFRPFNSEEHFNNCDGEAVYTSSSQKELLRLHEGGQLC